MSDKIQIGKYDVLKSVVKGEGGFGCVYEGVRRDVSKERVAVKQCRITNDAKGGLALGEIKHFQHIPPHKHIVRMYDFDYKDKSFWIIMELCDVGDLDYYMKRYGPTVERQLKIMHQCGSALKHLHTLDVPIIHRDIKPANILFRRENGKDVAKLTDFGLSKALEEDLTSSRVGTPLFIAPEIHGKEPYTKAVDVYSFGLVCLAMINYRPCDERLFPLSETAISKDELIAVGQEMYVAALQKKPQPVVVSVRKMDSRVAGAVKELVNRMVVLEAEQRDPIEKVLTTLEDIDGGKIAGTLGRPRSARQIYDSNMSAGKTVAGFHSTLGTSSGYGSGTAAKSPQMPKLDEDDETIPEDTGSGSDSEEESSADKVDIGYELTKKILEERMAAKHKQKKEMADMAAILPLLGLLKALVSGDGDSDAKKFGIGDRVVFDKDMTKAKELQKGHGEWVDGMSRYLDEEGVVREYCNGDRDLLTINPKLLERCKPEETKETRLAVAKSEFKPLDSVKVKVTAEELEALQDKHGGYNKKMKRCIGYRGIVHSVDKDLDVSVEFLTGERWMMNPKALKKVDMSKFSIEAGDMVVVINDIDAVKRLQEDHGGWADKMRLSLGKTGMVKKVGSNNRAVVEVKDTSAVWNIKALRLIAKSEEILLIALKKAIESE